MRLFLGLSRLFFLALMLASAVGKLFDMPGFYQVVASYELLPDGLVVPAAWALTLTELAVGLGLMVPFLWVRVASALPLLHLFYLMGLASAYMRGLALQNCGCFGVYWPRPLTEYSLLEDLILLAWAVVFYSLSARDAQLE